MKILKGILIFIVALVLLVLVVALFVKKDIGAEKSIVINKPKADVFAYLKYLKNQDEFSKWARMDPNMKKTYKGTDATPGFMSAWEGNKEVGKGEQEIKTITEGEKVTYEVRFEKPFKSVMQSYITTQDAGNNQTKVTWGINGKMNYPTNIMRLFMSMDKMMGDDLTTGLTNLKTIQEKQ